MTYIETRQRFLNRCAALLPKSLHSSLVLDEAADTFPEIHTAERDYVCALDSHEEIIRKTDALTDSDLRSYLVTLIPSAIEDEADEYDDESFQLTQSDAADIMLFARLVDPTDSNIAAEIRDIIHSKFEHISV